MKDFNKRMAAREGFTLVELIVVIAILAILAAVAYPAYTGYIDKANSAKDLSNLSSVLTAVEAACAGDTTVGNVTQIVVKFGDASSVLVTVNDKFDIYAGTSAGGTKSPSATTGGVEAAKIFKDLMPNFEIKSDKNESATWTSDSGEWTLAPKSPKA